MAIIEDSKPGVEKTGTPFAIEPSRRKAIELALHRAQRGDIVLLAGKGHENTQTTRAGIMPFDDIEAAREALAAMGYVAENPGAQAGMPVPHA
jgi:UDP-N-acetylmuramyl tripeptide synthase